MRADGGDDGDGAVLVRNVVLIDEGRPGFLYLVTEGRVERDQVDFAAPWVGHLRWKRRGFLAVELAVVLVRV